MLHLVHGGRHAMLQVLPLGTVRTELQAACLTQKPNRVENDARVGQARLPVLAVETRRLPNPCSTHRADTQWINFCFRYYSKCESVRLNLNGCFVPSPEAIRMSEPTVTVASDQRSGYDT
jgi:hypothetical protein